MVSIFGATASGVMALLVEYKDKETGKITKWGRYALLGLAISFLIGTSNAWVDYIQKSWESRDAAEKSRINTEKTLQIVSDINRTLNPFKDVRVGFFISYPFDHPELARYRQRLDQGVRALLPDIRSQEVQGVRSSFVYSDGTIRTVRIKESSPLFPNSREYLASEVFSRRGLTLYFFKTPIDLSTVDIGSKADITMRFRKEENIEVGYDLISKAIYFKASSILSKSESWNSSGKIASILDLRGTQLSIQLEYDAAVTLFTKYPDVSGHSIEKPSSTDSELDNLGKLPPRPGVHLERINLPRSIDVDLRIADRREWHLPGRKFQLYEGFFGTTNFVYSFPRSYEEILTETEW